MHMQHVDLGGTWTLRDGEERRKLNGTVPGCVHTDLMAAEMIPDPFVGENELAVQWVSRAAWVYAREFEVPAKLLSLDRVLLVCDGLDTLATVKLNGRVVAKTDNQFRTYEFDVKALLKAGGNRIEIRFDSPLDYMERMQKAHELKGVKSAPHEPHGRGWVRKSQSNFGWDWGPVLPTCGIWRPIRLVAFDDARLRDVMVLQHHRRGAVDLEVRVEAEKVSRAPLRAAVTVSLNGRRVASETVRLAGRRGRACLRIGNPRLWWPNGMGDQPLYDVKVELLDKADWSLDTSTRRIGLRTLELERKKDAWGESFTFVVNGTPFFAKGANWIPADHFLSRATPERYAGLLRDAAAANMNMLRVWGGGIYEEDVFFDLCDELGLLVWHDFMFACCAYPLFDAAFRANVKAEAEDNVRRIRHHASMALWCGNNELEQGPAPKQMPWDEYGLVFDKLLPAVVRALDPQRPYWPSSPHSPHGDRCDHSNAQWGDAHLWAVWHGRQPFEWYRTAFHRFCSEFGFQSFPEPATVRTFTAAADRNVTSPVMEHHQRSWIGNAAILQYMAAWFRMPKNFEMTIWASQLLQALAIKYAVEHWRRHTPRCMGALYWQINDVWPVASWASIDYLGRWKALHHAARKFFAPVLVSAVEDSAASTVDVFLSNDLRRAVRGTVRWSLTTVDGTCLAEDSFPAAAPAGASRKVKRIELADVVREFGARRLFVWVEFLQGGRVVSSNMAAFVKPKTMELEPPAIDCTVRPSADGCFRVTLEAKKPALFTWLESSDPDTRFSDNFLHLEPGRPVEIDAAPRRRLSAAAFRRGLVVRSLIDTF